MRLRTWGLTHTWHIAGYGLEILRLNFPLEDQPQSYYVAGQCRVLTFRDSRLTTPTHFKTLISLGSSAPRPGAPIRNFMVYVLGHEGSRHNPPRSGKLDGHTYGVDHDRPI
jgi:hypothetical protein